MECFSLYRSNDRYMNNVIMLRSLHFTNLFSSLSHLHRRTQFAIRIFSMGREKYIRPRIKFFTPTYLLIVYNE